MVAEGNDDEIEDVVIPTIPDAVGPARERFENEEVM